MNIKSIALLTFASGCLVACGADNAPPSAHPAMILMAQAGQSDVIVFGGARANYTIAATDSGFSVSDNIGAGGVRNVTANARLRFSDVSLDLRSDAIAAQAFRVYQAAFNRTPDLAGLGYWIGMMDQGMGVNDVAAGFVGSSEFKAQYGTDPSNTQIVNKLYQNVLHRAGEAAGLAYWVGALDSHAVSTAQVLAGFSDSPENKAGVLAAIQGGIAFLETGIAYTRPGISVFAGSGVGGNRDGLGTSASLYRPWSIATDGAGNVYVADAGTASVRKITPAGVVATLHGAANAIGLVPFGGIAYASTTEVMTADRAGNVYGAGKGAIVKVDPNGQVTILAGTAYVYGAADGTGAAARFQDITALAVDGAGNVYAADGGSNTIRKITAAGVVTTLAGTAGMWGSVDGVGAAARFGTPSGVAVDGLGNVYVADASNEIIRKVTADGVVTTLAGTSGAVGIVDGIGAAARFDSLGGIAVDAAGNIYVTDLQSVRKLTPAGVVTMLAGQPHIMGSVDGVGAGARFDHPTGVAVDASGTLYVVDNAGDTVRKIDASGAVSTFVGSAPGSADGTGGAATFHNPEGAAIDGAGNIYIADTSNDTIRKISAAGVVTTLAGSAGVSGSADGVGSAARFYWPTAVAVDGVGNVYVADTQNSTIRKITPAGLVTTIAGTAGKFGSTDGPGASALLSFPGALAVDQGGNIYFTSAGTLRRIASDGNVTTIAKVGGGGLAVDAIGNVYVTVASTICKVSSSGVVTTLAGSAALGSADGTGSGAQFYQPSGLAIDRAGNLYVSDTHNQTIRKVTAGGVVTTVAGQVGMSGIVPGELPGGLSFPGGLVIDSNGVLYVISVNGILKIQI
jgi:sugar lactone lactonase YvrE